MKTQRLFRPIYWLLPGLLLLTLGAAWAQERPYAENDRIEIRRLARERIEKNLPALINNIVVEDLPASEANYMISNSFLPGDNDVRLFINDEVLVEDDIDPDHVSSANVADKSIKKYLNDILLYYGKNANADVPSFIIKSVTVGEPIVETASSALIEVNYTSLFKGKHKSGRTYQNLMRVAQLRATRIGNTKKWEVFINLIRFYRPGAGQTQTVATTAPATTTVAETPPPPPIDIREPTAIFRQEDYDFNVTVRYNKKALDVLKSESPRLPMGQYRRLSDGDYELAGNRIRFEEADKNRFRYTNRDRNMMGLVRVEPPKPTPAPPIAKQLPDVVAPGYLPLDEDQRKRKEKSPVSTSAAESVAVTTPKATPAEPKPVVDAPKPVAVDKPVSEPPKPAPAKPVAEKPKPVDVPAKPLVDNAPATLATPTPPVLANTPKPTDKPKPDKPIVQKPVALSVAPALKKSLNSEQQRLVAGMRLRGWLQVVGGLAALGGSYMAYSGIKKDYDAYAQQMSIRNADYNLYRELSRRDVPPPPNTLSMMQYGSPGIYGVYGGGAAGFGLTVNGIRTLLRAGKMGKKK
ncbi:hypothetical protein [Fibrella aquatica]|uniref:hypothetical protein n=1 Tax=Fibrella aquatica TaxID=3242487 RepID=UPI003522DA01